MSTRVSIYAIFSLSIDGSGECLNKVFMLFFVKNENYFS